MVSEKMLRLEQRRARQRRARDLASLLAGEVVQPGDDQYEEARGTWNASADRHPTVIVRPSSAAEVATAVDVAREEGLTIAVRSGGHSMAGHSAVDGGIVIDLSRMKGIEIDSERRTARIEPGLTWGEVAEQAQAHGLALTSGDMQSVGVGGLATGGGIGWMVRKHGLTVDNTLSAEVVTAGGQIVRTSAEENADLFWAIRGGGGNFGIVTAFEFQLHPTGLILGGAVIYNAKDAYAILRAYGDYAANAPDELTTIATIMHAPPAPFIPPHMHFQPVVVIMVCYTGEIEEGQRVVAPLRSLDTPVADVIAPMPYPAMFAMTAEGSVHGFQHAVRSMFLPTLDDEALQTIVAQRATMTSPRSMAQIRILGGAMSRVPEDATAFAHRDKQVMVTIADSWADPARQTRDQAPEADQHWAEVERFWRAMRPHASGVYVNFLADEGEDRVKEAYTPATYERLVALKRRYDPTNLFHLNQNIKPTPADARRDDPEQKAA